MVFELARAQRIQLQVVDARGREIIRLADGPWEAGHHELRWDGRDDKGAPVASGAYHLRLRTQDGEWVRGILLLK